MYESTERRQLGKVTVGIIGCRRPWLRSSGAFFYGTEAAAANEPGILHRSDLLLAPSPAVISQARQ